MHGGCVCGTQRDSDPDHQWSEADRNDKPGSAYSASKTAAEARTWELAEEHKEKFAVTTVHPAVVIGTLLPGQPVQSTMGLLMQLCKGNRLGPRASPWTNRMSASHGSVKMSFSSSSSPRLPSR